MLRIRWRTVVLPLLVASSFVVLPATPSLAAGCSSTALVPVAHEFLVSQGSVPSAVPVNPAVPFPYVQGKDTLFKVFLSLPSCASRTQSIVVTGGTLTVRNGAFTLGTVTPSFSPVAGTAVAASYTGTAPANNVGDPIFVIPGAMMSPCGSPPAQGCSTTNTAAFTATFSVTLNYTATGVTGTKSLTFSSTSSPPTPSIHVSR